jgi:ubiquinone/menaquinone biosynthesis C-methylase UbiE
MVENCQKRFKDLSYLYLRCARAEMLPYPNEHFTKVCSVNSIFYWEDFERGVAEIYRVLREMGRVVLTYTRKKDLDKKWFAQYGIKPFDDEEVQRALSKAGFHDVTPSQMADRHREFVCMVGLKPSAYQESK